MFLIDITINPDRVPVEKTAELLAKHREWFTEQFNQGHFLIVGPYKNKGLAGIVIAQGNDEQVITDIIKEDAYYPDMATYHVSEFQGNLVAENMSKFKD